MAEDITEIPEIQRFVYKPLDFRKDKVHSMRQFSALQLVKS